MIIISLIPSQNFNKFILFMVKYWWSWFALLTLIMLLGKFQNYLKNVWNSFFLFWSLAKQYFWYVLFLLLIDVNIPSVNHGLRFTLHSFKDIFFNGGSLSMIDLMVLKKDSNDLPKSPLSKSTTLYQLVFCKSFYNLF